MEKSRTFAIPFEKKGYEEFLKRLKHEREIEKILKKIWRLKNNAYLCSPVQKTDGSKGIEVLKQTEAGK